MIDASASIAKGFFKGDVAAIMICSASIPTTHSYLRAIGRSARLQRVRKQFDPVLAPKRFAIEHVGWRPEHINRQRVLAVLFIDRADVLRCGTLDQRMSWKAAIIGEPDEHIGLGEIKLVFPHCRETPPK